MNAKRTVCQLVHGLGVGGAEVLAARIARELGQDYRFLLVCLDEVGTLGHELVEDGFTVELLGRRPGLDWCCTRRLASLLRRERVDLLHVHQCTPFFYGMVARLLYRRPPVLLTEHGRHFPDLPSRRRMLAHRLLLEPRDRVVGVGRAVGEALVANEGIPARRVEVIYNGIDVAPFAQGSRTREEARRELGISDEDFALIQVARLVPIKDHGTALLALRTIVDACLRARLIIVGEGPELEAIQGTIRRLHLEPYVRLTGLRSDVARLLSAADLFLLTSLSEGIPLTVIEAMAAGLPVVATQVGGIPEIFGDGELALLASPGDASALARHVIRLARDPALRAAMGRRGRELVAKSFSDATMLDKYRTLYGEMTGERSDGPGTPRAARLRRRLGPASV